MQRTEDHVLHDLARVRLVDPTAAASRRISSMLGTTPSAVADSADITVTFEDRPAHSGTLRWIGRHRSAYDDTTFFAVERSSAGPGLCAIPFETLGNGPIEITCDRSVTAPPGLIDILNLVMLSKGVLPLHGSAFTWRDIGVVAAGWSKGGKTETLLAFAGDGADVIADEWTYITRDRRVFGVAEPVRLESAHLEHLGPDRALVNRAARARAAVAQLVVKVHHALFERGGLPGARVARALVPLAEARDAVSISPRELFGDRYVGAGRLDRLVFLVTADVASPRVLPVTPDAVAARMALAHIHHRRDLVARYHEFRYAFPDRTCALLERIEAVERGLLEETLDGVPCIELHLPQPPAIAELHRVLVPVLSEQG